MMPRRGPQVLGDGQQLTARRPQVNHGLADLGAFLAESQDQVRLGDQPRLPGGAQHVQRPRIPEARPDPPEDPRHGLDVVGQDLRRGVEDLRQPAGFGVEVRDQQLHPAPGNGGVDLPAGLRVQPGAAVSQVITRDPGHGRVPQPHRRDRLRDPPGLARIQRLRLAGVDLAEVAPAGALIPADEEGGLAVFPALEDIRAAGLLADRVQAPAPDQGLQLGVSRPGPQPGLDPRRLTLDRDLAVAGLQTEHPPALRCQYHPSRVCCRGGDSITYSPQRKSMIFPTMNDPGGY